MLMTKVFSEMCFNLVKETKHHHQISTLGRRQDKKQHCVNFTEKNVILSA